MCRATIFLLLRLSHALQLQEPLQEEEAGLLGTVPASRADKPGGRWQLQVLTDNSSGSGEIQIALAFDQNRIQREAPDKGRR